MCRTLPRLRSMPWGTIWRAWTKRFLGHKKSDPSPQRSAGDVPTLAVFRRSNKFDAWDALPNLSTEFVARAFVVDRSSIYGFVNVWNLRTFLPFLYVLRLSALPTALFVVSHTACCRKFQRHTVSRRYLSSRQTRSSSIPLPHPNASLTRSCVFFGEGGTAGTVMEKGAFYREGTVGVSLTGDIRMRSFVSQGARRVGPTFNADKVFIRHHSELLLALLPALLGLFVSQSYDSG